MNLPSQDRHLADLAAVLVSELLEAEDRRDQGWISPMGCAVRFDTAFRLARECGFGGFLAALLDAHDDGRFDS